MMILQSNQNLVVIPLDQVILPQAKISPINKNQGLETQ
ncbi:hypothetical protein SAMN05421766_1198 [Zobellia uliginosa]|uniref:Uncharacterized protein n=1 Tax=Zobellia uliginosa TaxID=143224 RepID=A0ABY1L2R0_9FLAO|nr:hypothetical protein SAMN05421766_1198 [Zobellia uliginosa]